MYPRASQSDGRETRASTARTAGKDSVKTREELLGTGREAVKNVETGRAYLESKGYTVIGQEYTVSDLSYVLLLLAQGASQALLIEGVRAVALILEDDAKRHTKDKIHELVKESLAQTKEQMSETLGQMNDAADHYKSSSYSMNRVMEEFREECHVITHNLGESAEDLVGELTLAIMARAEAPARAERKTGTQPQVLYAQAHLPSTHESMLARNEVKRRQVLVDKAPNASTNGLKDLTEGELVTKGSTTLNLMGMEAGDAPEGARFNGAKKLKNGGVVYEMNSAEAATWLRGEAVMKSFLAKFGGTSVIKDRAYTVVVEYVPTSLDLETNQQVEYQNIETSNDVPPLSIISARWIKSPRRRNSGQKTAHLLLGLKSQELANKMIREGLYIAGKKVWARKLIQEPRRCLKCQKLGAGHLAANCPQKTETCGTCAQDHRTEACQVSEQSRYRCTNCQEDGHATWDRQCPTFLTSTKNHISKNPENKYRYFPTNDPGTWETTYQESRSSGPEDSSKGRNGGLGEGTGYYANGARGQGGGRPGGRGRDEQTPESAVGTDVTPGLTQSTLNGFITRDETVKTTMEAAAQSLVQSDPIQMLQEATKELTRVRAELERERSSSGGEGSNPINGITGTRDERT